MGKSIAQFRYYSDNDTRNQPIGLSSNQLQNNANSILSSKDKSKFASYTQLGIQTLPGVRVYLNNSNEPIIIGSTGIYELDLEGISEINHIYFDAKSLQMINDNPNAYLIIDVIGRLKEKEGE